MNGSGEVVGRVSARVNVETLETVEGSRSEILVGTSRSSMGTGLGLGQREQPA